VPESAAPARHRPLGSQDERPSARWGDGGFTGWTTALTADAKERCLISCIATERLTQLIDVGD